MDIDKAVEDLEKEREEEEKEESGGLGEFLESVLEEDEESKHISYDPTVHFHSSESMDELDDKSVDFAITSPPYNAGWDYGDYDDNLDYAAEYIPMLARVFTEVYQKLKPGGRFCINIPSLLRSGKEGGFPISSHIATMMGADNVTLGVDIQDKDSIQEYGEETVYQSLQRLRSCDWRHRETIIWVKPFNHDGLAPNGSFPRPGGILLNNMHEVILVFQKPGKRDYSDMSEERIENSKINKTEDEMCDDVWRIQPDSWSPKYIDEEDIPVFPEKLVRRAVRLWTYEGDTVLDPFAGRFTTGKVCKEENRNSVGYELRESLEKDIKEYTGQGMTDITSW